MTPVFLFPSWERPVVGNLSDIVGPNWELGPNRSATPTGSVGVMGVWEPKKLAWEAGSQKTGAKKLPAFLSMPGRRVGSAAQMIRHVDADYQWNTELENERVGKKRRIVTIAAAPMPIWVLKTYRKLEQNCRLLGSEY